MSRYVKTEIGLTVFIQNILYWHCLCMGGYMTIIVHIVYLLQLFGAKQLAQRCLYFISTNYLAFKKRRDFDRLTGANLEYVETNRWPPASYLNELHEYEQQLAKNNKKCSIMWWLWLVCLNDVDCFVFFSANIAADMLYLITLKTRGFSYLYVQYGMLLCFQPVSRRS